MDRNVEIISHLGGPTELAKRLGYTPQRVSNWNRTGIPGKVWMANRKLFDDAERQIKKVKA